ncbi:MAG: glycosyltransferase [Acidimicrobiales bacterium]
MRATLPSAVEVMPGGTSGFPHFWAGRAGSYDLVLVSRPHNKAMVNAVLARSSPPLPRIVYDAEAVNSFRDLGLLRHLRQDPSPRYERRLLAREMRLVDPSVAVVAVCEAEARVFTEHCLQAVSVLGHALDPAPSPRPHERRRGLLFVGAISDAACPNLYAASWLSNEVFPRFLSRLGGNVQLVLAGSNLSDYLRPMSPAIDMRGPTEDLAELYDQVRVFVAPAPFGAGIPLKVLDAAAHGVPVVASSLLARQLGWRDGVELLVAHDAESFAAQCARLYDDAALWHRLREAALARVGSDYSPSAFSATLGQIVEAALAAPAPVATSVSRKSTRWP